MLRAGWVGLVKADSLRNAAATQQVIDVTLPARRGSITDRTGTELAVSEPASDISATPYLVKDPQGAAAKLAPLLGVPQDELLRKLTERSGFVKVGIGFIATRAISGSPVVIPPSRPPERFVSR